MTRMTCLAASAAFAFAAFAAPGVASAATHHKTMMMSKGKGSTASADNSADQLNATSLADAKSNTPYAPAAAPTAAAPTTKKGVSKKM